LIVYLRKNPDYGVFEFDLKGFFNRVRPTAVFGYINKRTNILANIIMKMITEIVYEWKTLEKETELKIHGRGGGEHLIVSREGLPQGLPISPLLCSLALELYEPPKGLFMYADDGVFVGRNTRRFLRF